MGTVHEVTREYVVLTNATMLDAPGTLLPRWNIALAHIVAAAER